MKWSERGERKRKGWRRRAVMGRIEDGSFGYGIWYWRS